MLYIHGIHTKLIFLTYIIIVCIFIPLKIYVNIFCKYVFVVGNFINSSYESSAIIFLLFWSVNNSLIVFTKLLFSTIGNDLYIFRNSLLPNESTTIHFFCDSKYVTLTMSGLLSK